MKRKIDAMHAEYGKDYAHKCGECSNFKYYGKGNLCNRTLQKCAGYGLTHSEATDWAQKWTACGMFNKSFEGLRPMIDVVKRCVKVEDETPIEGQINILGGLEGA